MFSFFLSSNEVNCGVEFYYSCLKNLEENDGSVLMEIDILTISFQVPSAYPAKCARYSVEL